MNIYKHVFKIGCSVSTTVNAGIDPDLVLVRIVELFAKDQRPIRIDLNGCDTHFFLRRKDFFLVSGWMEEEADSNFAKWRELPIYIDNTLASGSVSIYTRTLVPNILKIENIKTSLDLCICRKCQHNKIEANKFVCDKTTFTGRIHEFVVDGRLVEQQRYLELETDIKDCPYALEHTMSVGNADAKP